MARVAMCGDGRADAAILYSYGNAALRELVVRSPPTWPTSPPGGQPPDELRHLAGLVLIDAI